MTFEDVATMTHDEYKLQLAKLKYEELEFRKKLKETKNNESQFLSSVVESLPDDPEELVNKPLETREILNIDKLSDYVKKYVSLVNMLCNTTSDKIKLEETFNGYNKIRVLQLMKKSHESEDQVERAKINKELLQRMEWLFSND